MSFEYVLKQVPYFCLRANELADVIAPPCYRKFTCLKIQCYWT
ncbi:hypothetical protein NC652_021855 [Populus alba x Populus x berolinensis]|nr:hypothetical protein NC652_021855 [Populus alba x Populus x berolinensis]